MTARILDVSEAEYHNDPCKTPSLSQSIANVLLNRSALHAWHAHPKLGGRPFSPTKEMDAGTVGHAILLGTDKNHIVIADFDDFKTKDAKAVRDEAKAAGKTPVIRRKYDEIATIAEVWRRQLKDLDASLVGTSEVAIVWEEPTSRGNVACRSRLDHVILDEGRILDVKTTKSAHPDKCGKKIADFGYDVQHAAYTSAVTMLDPSLRGRVRFTFLFCEMDFPYLVTPIELDGQYAMLGEMKWSRALETWAECLQTNNWPGYATQAVRVSPKPYQLTDEAYGDHDTEEGEAA